MRTAAFLSLFLVFSGCPHRAVDFGKNGEPRSVDELLRRVEVSELAVVSVKGEAKLKAASDQGSGSAGLFVAVADPAKIHLEALDFFGRPQAQLVTDGMRFGLYDAQQGKFFAGPASPANLRRVLPVRLTVGELAALLRGRVPRRAGEAQMTFDADRGRFVVTLKEQRLEIEPPSYRVVKCQGGRFDVVMDQIEQLGGLTFPKHAVLTSGGATMELWWKDLELNVEPDASFFDMTAPDGVPVVPVDEQGLETER